MKVMFNRFLSNICNTGLVLKSFKFEADGTDTIRTGSIHDAVFHPVLEVAAPVEYGEVFIEVVPGPSTESVGFLSFFNNELLAILEALTFSSGVSSRSHVVFAKHVFWMKPFNDCDFNLRHVFSPKGNIVSDYEIFKFMVTGGFNFK